MKAHEQTHQPALISVDVCSLDFKDIAPLYPPVSNKLGTVRSNRLFSTSRGDGWSVVPGVHSLFESGMNA
jgi:hypothetical protein